MRWLCALSLIVVAASQPVRAETDPVAIAEHAYALFDGAPEQQRAALNAIVDSKRTDAAPILIMALRFSFYNQAPILRALEALTQRSRVRLHTDSQYVMLGISEWIHSWKKRGWRTADKKPVKNEDLWRLLDDLAREREIEWLWVRGHDGNPGNERADELANLGVAEIARRA